MIIYPLGNNLNPLNQNFVNLEGKFLCWRDKYIEYLYFWTKIRLRKGPGTHLMLLEVLSCENKHISDEAIVTYRHGNLGYSYIKTPLNTSVFPLKHLTKFSVRNFQPFRFPLRVFAWHVCEIIQPRVAS